MKEIKYNIFWSNILLNIIMNNWQIYYFKKFNCNLFIPYYFIFVFEMLI